MADLVILDLSVSNGYCCLEEGGATWAVVEVDGLGVLPDSASLSSHGRKRGFRGAEWRAAILIQAL